MMNSSVSAVWSYLPSVLLFLICVTLRTGPMVQAQTTDSVLDVCGQEMTEPAGEITLAGIINDDEHDRVCEWSIILPSDHLVQLTVDGFYVYWTNIYWLEVFQPDNGTLELVARFSELDIRYPVRSSTNELVVRLSVYSVSRVDLDATYTSVSAQDVNRCGQDLGTTEGEITSPNYPGNYSHLTDCRWSITVLPMYRLFLVVHDIDIPGCGFNALWIHDGNSTLSPVYIGPACGRYEGDQSTFPRTYGRSSSNTVIVRFVSDNNTRTGRGFHLTWTAACEETILNPEGTLQSPNYPDGYPESVRCTYHFQPRYLYFDYLYWINFTALSLEPAVDGTCHNDYVEILQERHDGFWSSKRYCGNTPPEPLTAYYRVSVRFVSNGHAHSHGYKLEYWFAVPECGPALLTSSSGEVTSPGYPAILARYHKCTHTIQMAEGNTVTLFFNHLDLGYTCSYATLSIYDGDSAENGTLLHRLCGWSDYISSVTSAANVLTIVFESLENWDSTGFSASYFITRDRNECGQKNVTGQGQIALPSYEDSWPTGVCMWNITVPTGYRVQLIVDTFHPGYNPQLDHEDDCRTSNQSSRLELFQPSDGGQLEHLAVFCRDDQPWLVRSTRNSLLVKLLLSDDTYSRFSAHYTSVAAQDVETCGYHVTSAESHLTSPNFPDHYDNNLECSWTIRMHPGYVLNLHIFDIDIEVKESQVSSDGTHFSCGSDSLRIYDGDNRSSSLLGGPWCGRYGESKFTLRSSGYTALVVLVTDDTGNSRGFNLSWTAECWQEIIDDEGTLQSPYFPNNYPNNAHCTYYFLDRAAGPYVVRFTSFALEATDNGACDNDYVKISRYSYSERFCGTTDPWNVTLYTPFDIVFVTNDHIVDGGFQITYERLVRGHCGGNYEGSGELQSPHYPDPYPHNVNCTWIITAHSGHTVRLTFHYFELESSDCVFDFLKIRDGTDVSAPLLDHICGRLMTPFTVKSTGNSMRVEFVTDGTINDFHGFNATWISVPLFQEVCTEIHMLKEPWSNDLSNNQSRAFFALQDRVTEAAKMCTAIWTVSLSMIDSGLQDVQGYVRSRTRSFRPGSVIVDVVLVTNQSLSNMSVLQSAFIRLVSTGFISDIPVNSSHSPFYEGGFYLVGPSLTYSSPGKIIDAQGMQGNHWLVSGSDISATCVVRTPGYWHPVFEWRLGGTDLDSLGISERVTLSEVVRSDSDPFHLTSRITIRKLFESESGKLTCQVRADTKMASSDVTLQVVARQSASLTPATDIVTSGSDVTLKCARIAGYDVPWRAVLYRVDGDSRVEVDNKNMGQDDNSTDFQVSGVTSHVTHQCNVSDDYGWALSNEADVIIRQTDAVECHEDDIWPPTPAGNTVRLQCPEGYDVSGLQTRACSQNGVWGDIDSSQCVRQDLQNYKTMLEEGTTVNRTWEVVAEVANSTSGSLLAGDISAVAAILDDVVNITAQSQVVVESSELQDFVQSVDNVLHAPEEVWINQTAVAQSLVSSVDEIGKAASVSGAEYSEPIVTDKIVLEVGSTEINQNDIQFPDSQMDEVYPDWVQQANTSLVLSRHAFPDNSEIEVKYSAVIYRNLTNVFSALLGQDRTKRSINSPILALSVLPLPAGGIRQPVKLTFEHITSNFSSTSCIFLLFAAGKEGEWSDDGCTVTSRNSAWTVCECNHLTNFAVLMSPYRPTSTAADVLNILSIVGCSVSIVCLLLTIIIYRVFWGYVKSGRSVILMNLCVTLILAYVTFLAGVNRVEHKVVCTVVAALLHYLWLVVFFLMLCEGVDIFISVVFVFRTKSVILKLLLMAYGLPVIIVGVSLGVTRLEGYGGPDFCWLSLKNNLLWAFVGPALATLLANFVVVVLVIRALFSSTAMISKDNREKAKSVLKAICVLTPILGLAWIFGVIAVNEGTLVFQVLFVIFNSLQGLMILIFHGLLNKQVREGFQNKRRKRLASSATNNSSGDVAAPQKRTSESSLTSNDKGKSTPQGRQVDPQIQRLSVKKRISDRANNLTADSSPKDIAMKNLGTLTTSGGMEPFFLNIQPDGDDGGARQSQTPVRGVRHHAAQLSENVTATPAPPISVSRYVMPSVWPAYRWIGEAQAVRRNDHRPSSRLLPHHLAPSSRRLWTPGSGPYSAFSAPRQWEMPYVGNTRSSPAQPTPWRDEPPVDY